MGVKGGILLNADLILALLMKFVHIYTTVGKQM